MHRYYTLDLHVRMVPYNVVTKRGGVGINNDSTQTNSILFPPSPRSSPLFVSTTQDFVDSMDEKNYVGVALTKPMGIVFEENDSEYGGIFVQSLKPDGAAALNGALQPGDQLVVVGSTNVSGLAFDEALGAIIESEGDKTKLTLFRGTASQFYGPTGPSREWLAAFCEKGGVAPS
jgi:PDZ domain